MHESAGGGGGRPPQTEIIKSIPLPPQFYTETQVTPTTANDTTKLPPVSEQPPRCKFYYAHSNAQHCKGLLPEPFTTTAPALTRALSRGPQHNGPGAKSSASATQQRTDRPAAPRCLEGPEPVPEREAAGGRAGSRRAGGTCPPLRRGPRPAPGELRGPPRPADTLPREAGRHPAHTTSETRGSSRPHRRRAPLPPLRGR